MAIAVHFPGWQYPKIIAVTKRKGQTQAAANKLRMLMFLEQDPEIIMYRINKVGGVITLRRLRIKPGTEITEPRLIGADFEDDI